MAYSYRSMLNELLQQICRCSIPLNYFSNPNFVVSLNIGNKTWCSPPGRDYLDSKERVAGIAFRALANKTEKELEVHLDLRKRRSVKEIDDIRDIIKNIKRRIREEYPLEQQERLMHKAVAIYNVIDHLEWYMHK